MKRACLFLFCIITFFNARALDYVSDTAAVPGAATLHRTMKKVTDVIVHDIYSPPVASRIYAYVSIAGYEAAISGNNQYRSFAGRLHGLSSLPKPTAGLAYSNELAAVHAMLLVAKALVISEQQVQDFHNALLQTYSSNMRKDVYEHALTYGRQVADAVLAWAAKDNYKETRSYAKYAVMEDDGSWKPTPPAYIKAIEPHWGKMRTFLVDSAQQFKPLPALPFSADSTSAFYKEARAVYTAGVQLDEEQKAIASFWDCNPFKMNVNGHVMYATKKISPGGHWINITAVACNKVGYSFVQSAEAYACVAITLADAFISCWDEKYRSRVIRPETYINQYIDEAWMPLLQTPPFPEYTSGHSVVSAACAVVLTNMFGDNFAYTDSTETEFDLAPRSFTSFKQAAKEAAISRFYGGIHYMPAINNGYDEGEKIGHFIIAAIRTGK
ncbi:vanadium-dependent haloperoxidase [Panacibacter sp. DH6]|uniref:Vanadium-dependent haloperoxidase n=1 Tax=Panacibacter microcysteis TaxID=2793269 RepID=A0A931E2R5_9BACT|nr:vanadium-dependent haloperoxidase [Panacibacter microcysteis]MBG9375062.1 vanadium-dependent haloperoxidase [Panacibacter microcysteis]